MGKQASETHQLNAGKPLSAQATHERCPETRRPWSRSHPGSAPPAAVGGHADSHYHRACVDHELAARVRRAEDSSVLGARRVVELHSESHAAELRSSGDARSGSRPTGRWSGAPGLRVHLVGHSTGAELVSSALPGLPAFRSIVSVPVSFVWEDILRTQMSCRRRSVGSVTGIPPRPRRTAAPALGCWSRSPLSIRLAGAAPPTRCSPQGP